MQKRYSFLIIKMKIAQFNKKILPTFSKKINVSIISSLFLGILGIVIYSNSFSNSFHFDDFSFICSNDTIRKIMDFKSIWFYWPSRFFGIFSFAVNYQAGQFEVFGYHLSNLVLHILTAILVFIFTVLTFSTPVMRAKEISKWKRVLAFFAAAIFISHPVQTQAVNYIFQRVTILSTFFYLLSLCLYIQSMLLIKIKRRVVIFCYVLSLVVALMGMFTKEIVFTLPVMILFYDFCFLRTNDRWGWKYTIPFLAMLPVIPLTVFLQKPPFLIPFVSGEIHRFLTSSFLDIVLNFLTQCRVVMTYLRLLVLPFNQNLDYDYFLVRTLWNIPVIVSFCFLSVVFVIAIRIFSKFRLLTFSFFWFFVALAVESTFIPMMDVINEHRLYLPMVGASIFIVSSLYYLLGRRKIRLIVVVLLFLVFFFSSLSYYRNKIWKDEISLWSDVIRKSPKKVRPYNERGLAYFDKGEYDKALIDFTQAVKLNRNYADGFYNRGKVYQKKGEYGKAVFDYTEAIKIEPGYVGAYINRGLVYYSSKEYENAILNFNQAIEINPLGTEAYFNLAYLYGKLGKRMEAVVLCKKILRINSNDVRVYYRLGCLYRDIGWKNEALAMFKKAIELDEKYIQAYSDLANIYAREGDSENLISLYKKAIANKLSYFNAYYNVGNLYKDAGKYKEAILLYQKMIKINPNSVEGNLELGSLYCTVGRIKKAIKLFKRTLELDPDLNVAYNNLALAYYYDKKYDLAVKSCDKAIKLGHKVSPKLLDMLKPYSK
ncbi:MAG: tetratricopeptide repeat protein [Candidatus Omnitrophica bacterium]|nr:tetratricopeptide repeat protein [Candidatus Omnitrophota bacterium]